MENQNSEIFTSRVCQSSPIIAGYVHAHANLVLEFVPDCKLINANRR
jgi:hypothetical protein